MATTKKKAPPKGRTTNKEKSLFGAAAVKRAKRVTPIVRVRRKDTGQLGTVTAVKSGFLKVKWDDSDKAAFARASTLRVVNGAKSSLRTRAIAEMKRVSTQRRKAAKAQRKNGRTPTVKEGAKKKRVTVIRAKVIKKVVVNRAKSLAELKRMLAEERRLMLQPAMKPFLAAHRRTAAQYEKEIARREKEVSRKGAKAQRNAKKNSGGGDDSSVKSPTSTSSDVRSPTRTSTKAHTSGNVTVTGGAGRGATTTVKITQAKRNAAHTAQEVSDLIRRQWPKDNEVDASFRRQVWDWYQSGVLERVTGGLFGGTNKAKLLKVRTFAYGRKKNPAKLTRKRVTLNAPAKRATKSGGAVRKEFLGRWPTKVIKVNASHHMPQTPRPDVLGRVEEIKVKGHGIIKMPPDSKLISTAGKKLWITERIAKPNPAGDKNTVHPLGELQHVVYHAHKSPRMDSLGQTHFKENRKVAYIHKMGEDSGKRPMLYVDHDGFPVLKGGNYTIDWRGIID